MKARRLHDPLTPARVEVLRSRAYDDGRRHCREAGGDREAYDPWRSRGYPECAATLTEAYETGWQDGIRDLAAPDPGW